MDRKDIPNSRFVEFTLTEDEFVKLPTDRKLIVQRNGIALEAPEGKRKFKLTRTWARLAFPKGD